MSTPLQQNDDLQNLFDNRSRRRYHSNFFYRARFNEKTDQLIGQGTHLPNSGFTVFERTVLGVYSNMKIAIKVDDRDILLKIAGQNMV